MTETPTAPAVQLDDAALRARVAALLERSRARSTALTDAVDDADLLAQHSPLMSPLVWDLAHIGSQEELWLVRDVGGREPLRPEIDGLYDAFQHSRASRVELPLLGPAEARAYVTEVREWIESVSTGTPTGSDAWDGYASLVVADACIASLRSGSPEKVAKLDPPALYTENAEVAK